ncbi:MAG: methyl-accepting chemotaxis protein [Lachnospiraceae bacterium]|nr:methyl-accepting chemotaxis protein [Lachnospiraceae bacterium]
MTEKTKYKGLAVKIFTPIIIIILFIIGTTVYSTIASKQVGEKLASLQSVTIKKMEDIEDVRYTILHTGEILTDASATHDEGGFEEAAEFASEVHALIDHIQTLDPASADKWSDIRSQYDNYYDMCVKMARAYIDEGIDAGNVIMEDVDALTDELSETVDSTTEDIELELERTVSDINRITGTIGKIQITISILYIVFVIYIAILVMGQMVTPITKISTSIQSLAERDLTVDEIRLKQKDEIGGLAYAFNQLRASLREIMQNMDSSTGSLEAMSGSMARQSESIMNNVSEITKAVNNVAELATSQATDVESSMDEVRALQKIAEQNAEASSSLSEASRQISLASTEGNRVLDGLYAVSKESEASFGEIFASIDRIRESASKIGEASNVIDSIASQTNLLSLNASIEAARAGDAGKGFAVVADEIRHLSDESAESVKEINDIIQELQENVENANQQSSSVRQAVEKQMAGVEDTRNSYRSISENLEIINSEIGQLGEISRSMTESSDRVGALMGNLSDAATQNAANTQETTASIQEVLSMTEQISNGTEDVLERTNSLSEVVKTYKV